MRGLNSKSASALRLADGPAGEAAGHFGDIFLGVAAVHAERVQFHQLAPVVLIQAAPAAPAGSRLRRPTDSQLSR